MARSCLELLVPGGEILVCTNLATWRIADLWRELEKATGCQMRWGERDEDITDLEVSSKTVWVKKSNS
jgi:hypothetical protein